jgi:hypothetical protein
MEPSQDEKFDSISLLSFSPLSQKPTAHLAKHVTGGWEDGGGGRFCHRRRGCPTFHSHTYTQGLKGRPLGQGVAHTGGGWRAIGRERKQIERKKNRALLFISRRRPASPVLCSSFHTTATGMAWGVQTCAGVDLVLAPWRGRRVG